MTGPLPGKWQRCFVVGIALAGAVAGAAPSTLGAQAEWATRCIEGEEPAVLQYGTHTFSCQIDNGADLDSFCFTGKTGDLVRVIVDGQTNNLDPRLELRDPNGQVIVDVFCGAGSFDTCSREFGKRLPTNGQYCVAVSDSGFDNSGNYALQVERIPPRYRAQNLPCNSGEGGSISPTTDTDHFRFEGLEGCQVRIVVDGLTNNFDTRLELWGPSGSELRDVSCGAGSFNTCSIALDQTLERTGTHQLLLFDSGFDNTGNYNLSLQCLFGCFSYPYVDGLGFEPGGTTLSWSDAQAFFDIVRGDLHDLRNSAGNFGSAGGDARCMGTGTQASTLDDGEIPAAGEGYFYLVRGDEGPYDNAFAAGQSYVRDVPNTCCCVSPPCASDACCLDSPPDLIGWWSGDGDTADLAGARAASIVGGVSYAPGKVDRAFEFPGNVGPDVAIAHDEDLNLTAFTILAWIRASGDTSEWRAITVKESDETVEGPPRNWWVGLCSDGSSSCSPGQLNLTGSTAGEGWNLVGGPALNDGRFHHVAVSYDGIGTGALYVDGKPVGATVSGTPGAPDFVDSPVHIGRWGIAAGEASFSGLIDELQIYSRALTPEEVETIYWTGGAGLCK